MRRRYGRLDISHFRLAQYRPFCKKWLYYEPLLIDRPGAFNKIFPVSLREGVDNVLICVTGIGADHQTFFVTNTIVDVKSGINGNSTLQCFPYYTYADDGSNRRENITEWVLA